MTLIAPVWSNIARPGLQFAKENIADGSIALKITAAIPSSPELVVFYLIYAGPTSVSSHPLFITDKTEINIPGILVGADWKFKVTAINGAINSIAGFDLVAVDLYSYPDPTQTTQIFTSGNTSLITEVVDYPNDGYLSVGAEIIQVFGNSSTLTETTFAVTSRGLFGTSIVTSAPAGEDVEIFKGAEASSLILTSIPSCGLTVPKWAMNDQVGILRVEDQGDGNSVKLISNIAVAPEGFSAMYYVYYKAETSSLLFKSQPAVISTSNEAILPNISTTQSYCYGIRAAYFLPDFTTSGMVALSGGFVVPQAVQLTNVFLFGQIGSMLVSSTSGFPNSGTLKIGREILKYSSKTLNAFNIVSRDVFDVRRSEDYPVGKDVSFFAGVSENNNYFWKMTNSWGKTGTGALPLVDGYGFWGNEYLQNPDGYREIPVSPLLEDQSVVEQDGYTADAFDYCGLRSNDQSQFLSGDFCAPNTVHGGGTYHGNSMLGEGGGINVFEGTLEREEMLLGITGEPFVLLRKKWTGRTCPHMSNRDEHANARCGICFHTGFIGGYDRYIHTRRIRPAEQNINGFFQMRVSEYSDEIASNETRGLTVEKTDLQAWCPALPIIRDRDVLIRYKFDYETGTLIEEFRYEVLSVTRNMLVLSKNGAQRVTMKRLNVTEEIYKFPVNLI